MKATAKTESDFPRRFPPAGAANIQLTIRTRKAEELIAFDTKIKYILAGRTRLSWVAALLLEAATQGDVLFGSISEARRVSNEVRALLPTRPHAT